jgi:hypothetical protein
MPALSIARWVLTDGLRVWSLFAASVESDDFGDGAMKLVAMVLLLLGVSACAVPLKLQIPDLFLSRVADGQHAF